MDDQPYELPELADATIAVQHVINASHELTARASRELGINATDMSALSLLEQHGPMGPAELASRLGIRSPSVTVLIDRLEKAGHVERTSHPHDRRRVTVAATPTAHRATLDFLRPSILAIDEASRALTPDENRAVVDFLRDVMRAMRA
ncbi:MarR family winged helix-turn-helix transcriptional regulator [Mangrovihabitans endophyticus]|nr:MarR family transcriptional regulator [Mangrovihabitans endophyticus]